MKLSPSALRARTLLAVVFFAGGARTIPAADYAGYCNAVQENVGFIRYPLGAIGVWSTELGEAADIMTRVPRVYPCVNSVVLKDAKDDWRASLAGDPSMLTVAYRADKPCGASTAAITNSPHLSVFKITFPEDAEKRYVVFDFGKSKVDTWAALYRWTERTVTRIDDQTIRATIGEPGGPAAHFTIKFNTPCVGGGIIDSTGNITEGEDRVTGTQLGMYARFDAPSVTVAIAESFTSPGKADEFLAAEFTDFDTVHQSCLAAWNQALGRVEIEGSEHSKRMAYTALYTLYANIINGSDGSVYAKYQSRPLSVSSSAYWQFIGGFQSCCWDNFRTAYPFLTLGYPEVMTDVVRNYLSRYERDGNMNGNICLFTGPKSGEPNIRASAILMAQAYRTGIPADYAKIYAALEDNLNDAALLPVAFLKQGYLTQPASGGKACSFTLEYATSMHSMGLLAKANHDEAGLAKYMHLSKNYENVWDRTTQVFRVRNEDGTWGAVDFKNWTWNPNPQGLFEGTNPDWMFAVPHDPYGLIRLHGRERFVEKVVDYCLNDTWFNDYQYNYPYLLYYDGAANAAQKIIRKSWVPIFNDAVMYEEASPKPLNRTSKAHYTSNAAWLLCSMLGLYPMQAPAGQYIISSPSVDKAVIHRDGKEIAVQANGNSDENIYIQSIKVNGKEYPAYMIPSERLAAGATIELDMGGDPTRGLGDLYISSSDGFLQNAELVSARHLRCVVESAGTEATTQIHSWAKPEKITVNGREDATWVYDEPSKTTTVRSTGTAVIEVSS